MSVFETPFPEWTDAFVEAEAEGREVELFAAILGVEVHVRPEGACAGSAHWRGDEPPGEPRYVARWVAWIDLCADCAVVYGAR